LSSERGEADPGELAEVVEDSGDVVAVRATVERPGYLVLADQMYPGWQVEVDGEPRPILRINYILKGVFLPEGEHLVRFFFRSHSFRMGLVLTLTSLGIVVLAALFVAIMRWRGRLRAKPEHVPLTNTAYSGKMLWFVLVFTCLFAVVSPISDLNLWADAPAALSPKRYTVRASLLLASSADARGDHVSSFGYLLEAYRQKGSRRWLAHLVIEQCELAVEDLLKRGDRTRARELLQRWAQTAPKDVDDPAYIVLERKVELESD